MTETGMSSLLNEKNDFQQTFETHNASHNFASETKHNEQRKYLSLLHGLTAIVESQARNEYFLKEDTQQLKSCMIPLLNSLLR